MSNFDYTNYPTGGDNNIAEAQVLANHTSSQLTRAYSASYSGEMPLQSPDDALKQYELDWKVDKSPLLYGPQAQNAMDYLQRRAASGDRDAQSIVAGLRDTEERTALYRADTKQFFDTVGKNWTPLQNKELVETFFDFADKADTHVEAIKLFKGGQVISAIAPLDLKFALGTEDSVEGKVVLTNAHQGGRGLRVDLLTLRKVCSNGLTIPVRVKGKIISHVNLTTGLVAQTLEAAQNGFQQFQQNAEMLANTPVTVEEAQMILIKEFGNAELPVGEQPKSVQTALALFQGEGKGSTLLSSYQTAWGLLNSVTEYYNHHSRKTQTHEHSLLVGSKAQQQRSFLESICSLSRAYQPRRNDEVQGQRVTLR